MKITFLPFFLPLLLPAAVPLPDNALLLRECLRYELTEQVAAQEPALMERCTPGDALQVKEALSYWSTFQLSLIRDHLSTRFAGDAQSKFAIFMGALARAESENNEQVRTDLARDLGLAETPADYGSLRRLALESQLAKPLAEASKLLGEIQTWAPLRSARSDVPDLAVWLRRNELSAVPRPTPPPSNPLREAEGSSEWTAAPGASSPMDSFADRRQKKRDQALADANAGMEQVAREREMAEQDAAARKLAAAQADAEAMRAQAQRLAATEQEALEQRENSWGNRLKRMVGATVSAATGAFTGGIGAEAGRRAANEVFK